MRGLNRAILGGVDITRIAEVIQVGHDINLMDDVSSCKGYAVSALACAIQAENVEAVRYLISKGADKEFCALKKIDVKKEKISGIRWVIHTLDTANAHHSNALELIFATLLNSNTEIKISNVFDLLSRCMHKGIHDAFFCEILLRGNYGLISSYHNCIEGFYIRDKSLPTPEKLKRYFKIAPRELNSIQLEACMNCIDNMVIQEILDETVAAEFKKVIMEHHHDYQVGYIPYSGCSSTFTTPRTSLTPDLTNPAMQTLEIQGNHIKALTFQVTNLLEENKILDDKLNRCLSLLQSIQKNLIPEENEEKIDDVKKSSCRLFL